MLFAVGFILFFYLDILISFRFFSIGMMPMAYLITAVSLFVSVILFRANPAVFNRRERRLNRIWIFFLFFISVFQFLSNMQGKIARLLSMDMLVLDWIISHSAFCFSTLLLVFTLIGKQKSVYFRWQVFSAFSCFMQAVLPVTVWRIMPDKVYYFYGLIQMPMLFGFLMMIDSVLKRRYGFAVQNRPQHE